MDGSNAPRTFVETSDDNLHFPTFSPDGKWLAYASTENGREDVYVRPYPEGDPVVGVSPSGGTAPAWSRDGKELFYRQGNQLVSIGVTTQDGLRRNGAPRPLFDYSGSTFPLRNYDVAVDGLFVMPGPRESLPPQPVTRINVVLNWFAELTRLAPGR
jgi:serine/threonine-protein kinase